MLFEINNIGKVREARLEMRGITVLAGNNSTGKSTFGKALYCIFNAFYDPGNEVRKERKNNVEDVIRRFGQRFQPPLEHSYGISKLADIILNTMDSPQEIQRIIQDAVEQGGTLIPSKSNDLVEMLVKKICDFAEVSDEQIQKAILEKYLAEAFGGQMTHINQTLQQGKISLFFKNRKNSLVACISKDRCIEYTDDVGIINRAFYVDTPFIMDNVNQYVFRRSYRYRYNHRQAILRHLHSTNCDCCDCNNISEEVINKKKLKSVLEHVNSVIPGEFKKTSPGSLGYREQGLEHPLEMTNISAGMKTFLIIKRLLETGAIKERDVLILDEPEIHLHPEWQIKFAEALVLLQKAFDLTILLTTHSPYFLRAVEVFSAQQGITDQCNYYYLENDEEGYCRVHDVTEDTDGIYQALAKPFQTLDNIYYAAHVE